MDRFDKDVLSVSAVAIATYLAANALLPRSEAPVTATGADSRHFRNCGEMREAGLAPIRRGDPGYHGSLDADGDGIACEPYLHP